MDHTQASSPGRQVRRGKDKLPLQPVSALMYLLTLKAWTPGQHTPMWPGAVPTFWRINELHSHPLAHSSCPEHLQFPFWQRPLGPIQFKLPGQNPLPLIRMKP